MTNKTISLYKESVDWRGQKITTLVGTYDVWLEESTVTRFNTNQKGGTEVVIGRGTIFLYDEVSNIDECIIDINGKRYDVVNVDTFWDDDGTFHHAEITYR